MHRSHQNGEHSGGRERERGIREKATENCEEQQRKRRLRMHWLWIAWQKKKNMNRTKFPFRNTFSLGFFIRSPALLWFHPDKFYWAIAFTAHTHTPGRRHANRRATEISIKYRKKGKKKVNCVNNVYLAGIWFTLCHDGCAEYVHTGAWSIPIADIGRYAFIIASMIMLSSRMERASNVFVVFAADAAFVVRFTSAVRTTIDLLLFGCAFWWVAPLSSSQKEFGQIGRSSIYSLRTTTVSTVSGNYEPANLFAICALCLERMRSIVAGGNRQPHEA